MNKKLFFSSVILISSFNNVISSSCFQHYDSRTTFAGTANRIISMGLIHRPDSLGNTILHNAVKYGYTEVVSTLLKARADLKARNNNGQTPYDIAEEKGYEEISQLIRNSYFN